MNPLLSKLPKVPPGKILVNKDLSDSSLGKEIIRFHGGVAFSLHSLSGAPVDFIPAQNTPVIVICSENSSGADVEIAAKIKRFKKAWGSAGVIVAERNCSTTNLYKGVQTCATLKHDSNVIPVASLPELPVLLKDLAQTRSNKHLNPFLTVKSTPHTTDLASKQLALLTNIPNVGRKKAQLLVEKFVTIRRLSYATEEELTECAGSATAKAVFKFFH
ncbi:Fanconi anemia core complex-associated protein 24-like [Cloeon dipterum]|uniref:Fanconi anemia core complex-associated protein 24-like n=1 Tax=Cloeon dipterum TaxID=197152 RepID=UPI0032200011